MNGLYVILMRKKYLLVLIFLWLAGIYFLVFDFEEVADNRMFLPGVIGLVMIPVIVLREIQK